MGLHSFSVPKCLRCHPAACTSQLELNESCHKVVVTTNIRSPLHSDVKQQVFPHAMQKGLILQKILCLMFVCFLFYVSLCQDCFCGFWISCGLMTCMQSK